ncbi:MAG: DUF177 domain-containing protein [Synechococcaceae cyanobacterium RL_1_2]|nr:DUF177 domain-containing protein [Synechococcaceae cyanobacterium RL_1_2]
MERIFIPHLLRHEYHQRQWEIEENISNLVTLTPVKGSVVVRHGGTFLEVLSQVHTIVNLTCDRCLKKYNHRLAIDTNEIIVLTDDQGDPEFEEHLTSDDLVESLSLNGHFDMEQWLFEQLSLALPLQMSCGDDCEGTAITSSADPDGLVDSRWASLAALKNQLPS